MNSHALIESLFLRLLGFVYLCAFGSLWPQIPGLIGSHGIVPAVNTLAAMRAEFGFKAFLYTPSILWAGCSDMALLLCCAGGCIAALLLIAGLFSRWSALACFVLYLSLSSVGQPFTSFQWDALLLETGFLALFTGAPWLVWGYRALLFRLMFESGVVKLTSHDPNWRNLHALRFHFFTQPLPTPLAYYFHHAPTWLLDSLSAATLTVELGAPFLLFGPKRVRYAGASLLIALQLVIIATGNYAFFNLLTLALCLWVIPEGPKSLQPRRLMNGAIVCQIALGCLAFFFRLPFESFEIANRYGLFAVMTTTRPEIIIEGSDDAQNWKEYSFHYKPGNLHRGLPIVAPLQPRLDWQMWFAALGNYPENPWIGSLLYRLLQGDKVVVGLLEPPPFPKPPKYIRALLYDYQFTEPAERARSGAVWQRKLLGNWFGPVSLKN